MKIYISTDLEGVGGVLAWREAIEEGPRYERSCKLLIDEANAAVEGAIEGGATKVVVIDNHWKGRNFPSEALNPKAVYYSGNDGHERFPEMDDSFAGLILIGYHAMAGVPGAILSHTWSSRLIRELCLNGKPIGEIYLEVVWAGLKGVPVLMVSGDEHACCEARSFLGNTIETVSTKKGGAREGGTLLAPSECCRLIREATTRVVAKPKKPAPVHLSPPFEIDLTLTYIQDADKKSAPWKPGQRIDAYTIRYEGEDINILLRQALDGL